MIIKKAFNLVAIVVIICAISLLSGCGNSSSSSTTPSSAPAKTTPSAPATAPAPAPAPQKSTPPAKAVEIQQGWQWVNEGSYNYVRGSVKNTGDRPIDYFAVTAEYLDANGNVLDTDYTNCNETLRPGNQKKFEIMHKSDPQERKVRIFVSEASYK